jgi:uncharacterized membrane protein YidH (DUF202 family)
MATDSEEEELQSSDLENSFSSCVPCPRPVLVHRHRKRLLLARPYVSPLLFPNTNSDARDHCANERTFLAWLKLAIWLDIVALAVALNFHLPASLTAPPGQGGNSDDDDLPQAETKSAFPLGLVFCVLSMLVMGAGIGNYSKTIVRYARRQAMAQSGLKTQLIFSAVGIVVLGTCILFLVIDARTR